MHIIMLCNESSRERESERRESREVEKPALDIASFQMEQEQKTGSSRALNALIEILGA